MFRIPKIVKGLPSSCDHLVVANAPSLFLARLGAIDRELPRLSATRNRDRVRVTTVGEASERFTISLPFLYRNRFCDGKVRPERQFGLYACMAAGLVAGFAEGLREMTTSSWTKNLLAFGSFQKPGASVQPSL